jgi:hypothetical protein
MTFIIIVIYCNYDLISPFDSAVVPMSQGHDIFLRYTSNEILLNNMWYIRVFVVNVLFSEEPISAVNLQNIYQRCQLYVL